MKIVSRLNNKRRRRFKLLWKRVYGDLLCAYCENVCTDPTIDHIIPKSKGGRNNKENLVIACFKCNNTKGDSFLNEIFKLKLQPIVTLSGN